MALLFVVMLLGLCATGQAQTWLDQPGVTGTQLAEVGSVRLRLPPGEWSLASEIPPGEPVPRRMYFQTDGKRIAATLEVASNRDPLIGGRGWGYRVPTFCYTNNIFLMESMDLYTGEYNCLMVNHNMMDFTAKWPIWRGAVAKAAEVGGLPRPMVLAWFGMASPSHAGFISVFVYLNPAVAGFVSKADVTWKQSEWHKNNATPDRIAYLNKIAAWARAYRKVVYASFE